MPIVAAWSGDGRERWLRRGIHSEMMEAGTDRRVFTQSPYKAEEVGPVQIDQGLMK